MATLSNPNLRIDALTGIPSQSRVTATVNVELTPFDMQFTNNGFPLQLVSDVWGDDSELDGDDFLFSFTPFIAQSITASGIYSFSKVVPNATLNEDRSFFNINILNFDVDEIYSSFTLTSYKLNSYGPWGIRIPGPTLTAATSINTPVVKGRF